MDDPKHEEDVVFSHEVVHDAEVADPEAVERIRLTADRLHFLAADSTASGGCNR